MPLNPATDVVRFLFFFGKNEGFGLFWAAAIGFAQPAFAGAGFV